MMLGVMASAERAARAIRRADKQMSDERARETLARGYAGRLGTVGPDGWPYVVPLLYVWRDYPPLDQITVYAIAGERLTGREAPLPAPADRWPRADHTKTPHARP